MKMPSGLRWKHTGKNIGEGGQGKVFEVTDENDPSGPTYALKGLSSSKDKPPKVLQRFYREIAATKSVNHPFVIKIIDHSHSGDEFNFYVMELLPGAIPLRKMLRDRSQNVFYGNTIKAIKLFGRLVEAIAAVSQSSIVHRDLSPSNVLILPDETIKIIDFGVCQIEGSYTITSMDEGVGTQNYMAPECEAGAEGEISFRSDLYSAGKILWSAITGQFAFSRESGAFNEKSMNKIFPNQPETWHLHHIFENTIRRRPGDRFSSPEEALKKLSRVSYVVRNNYPPLELTGTRCSICGFGKLQTTNKDAGTITHPFGNNLREGVIAVVCDYCGYWLPLDTSRRAKAMEARKSLE